MWPIRTRVAAANRRWQQHAHPPLALKLALELLG